TFTASATTSGPMPSPANTATFFTARCPEVRVFSAEDAEGIATILPEDRQASAQSAHPSVPLALVPAAFLCVVSASSAPSAFDSASRPASAAEEPGGFLAPARLVGADLVHVLERQADVVQPFEQALLAERVDVEPQRRAVRGGDGLGGEVDRQPVAGRRFGLAEQPVDRVLPEHDQEQPVLEAVVVEDVGEARPDDGADAVVEQRPGSVLARAAAAEIVAYQQDLRAPVARLIEHEVRVRPALAVVHAGLARIEVAPAVE